MLLFVPLFITDMPQPVGEPSEMEEVNEDDMDDQIDEEDDEEDEEDDDKVTYTYHTSTQFLTVSNN